MDDRHIALGGTVWMTVGGEQLGGTNRVGLLAALAQCGSITAAAKQVGLSYKAAWEAIDTMNNLAGEPLVQRSTGGKGGGGGRGGGGGGGGGGHHSAHGGGKALSGGGHHGGGKAHRGGGRHYSQNWNHGGNKHHGHNKGHNKNWAHYNNHHRYYRYGR